MIVILVIAGVLVVAGVMAYFFPVYGDGVSARDDLAKRIADEVVRRLNE